MAFGKALVIGLGLLSFVGVASGLEPVTNPPALSTDPYNTPAKPAFTAPTPEPVVVKQSRTDGSKGSTSATPATKSTAKASTTDATTPTPKVTTSKKASKAAGKVAAKKSAKRSHHKKASTQA